ncbi:uncharacterized protein N7473_011296 [Penicillium subrubescens]|uniref:uncharacterized protein n=1 Tax=Penicillium subrubescens TaxID=1316194 RepID=UPI002545BD0E|nr:uncharacterized protein N7473_011296 [Penicillium subrubescens]KAJ5880243.1 hypothetical protein N7473_011296 [Penicillium subrubescens]
MALSPVYTPSVPAFLPTPISGWIKRRSTDLHLSLEAKHNTSREIKAEVKKSRARTSWDAIWAKPKKSEQKRTTLLGISVGSLYCFQLPPRCGYEWKSSKVERDTPVLTESAWPTEITTVGHLATSWTVSPSMIAVPFTA